MPLYIKLLCYFLKLQDIITFEIIELFKNLVTQLRTTLLSKDNELVP